MAQKDITEKLLEDYNEVFADIVNVLLFEGERVVEPGSLQPAVARSQYKADDGKLHEQERDVAKFWTEKGVCISLIGAENQSCPDTRMPLRVIGYDGQSYRSQLLKQPDGTYLKKNYPVITMVLYFGLDEPWNYGTELYDVLEFRDERMKRYVSNYKINVFDIPSLPEETVKRFQSDFKYVADFFTQVKRHGNYVPPEGTVVHVDEVLKLLSVMTGDSDFESLCVETGERKVTDMCTVIEEMKKREFDLGRSQGYLQGESRLGVLILKLSEAGKYDEVRRAASDEKFRQECYKKYGID